MVFEERWSLVASGKVTRWTGRWVWVVRGRGRGRVAGGG